MQENHSLREDFIETLSSELPQQRETPLTELQSNLARLAGPLGRTGRGGWLVSQHVDTESSSRIVHWSDFLSHTSQVIS